MPKLLLSRKWYTRRRRVQCVYTGHTGLNTSWCHEISRKICVKHFEPRYANPPFPHFFLISFFLLCVLLNLTTMSNRVHEITIEYKNPLQVRPNKSANRLENAGKKHKIYFSSVDFFLCGTHLKPFVNSYEGEKCECVFSLRQYHNCALIWETKFWGTALIPHQAVLV